MFSFLKTVFLLENIKHDQMMQMNQTITDGNLPIFDINKTQNGGAHSVYELNSTI